MKKYQNLLWQIEKECEKWSFEKRAEIDLKEFVEKGGFYENSRSKYLNGFWIDDNVGNNSFVFEEGKKLFVPPLLFVGDSHSCPLRKGNKIVFRDKDEKGSLIESVGLDNFILTQGEKTGLPVYIVDNHNWAFYCWSEFVRLVPLEKGAVSYKDTGGLKTQGKAFNSLASSQTDTTQESYRETLRFKSETLNQRMKSFLVHIDAHKDEGEYVLNKKFEQLDLTDIKQITTNLKVSNYINAATQVGLIQKQFLSFTESIDFMDYEEKFELLKKKSQNIILNVDLDIFDPEVSLISLEEKVKLIGYFASKADLITFAMSPGFIDQDLAIEVMKIFLKYV